MPVAEMNDYRIEPRESKKDKITKIKILFIALYYLIENDFYQ